MLKSMSRNGLSKLVDFFKNVGQLKEISRAGWVKVGIKSPESVADHTFRTAFLCMIFSSLEGLDELKMLQMALLHDLPEVIIGDLTPSEKNKANKNDEENAMKRLLSFLPKEIRDRYLEIWHEYTTGETTEAKVVRQLENLKWFYKQENMKKLMWQKKVTKLLSNLGKKALVLLRLRHSFHVFCHLYSF